MNKKKILPILVIVGLILLVLLFIAGGKLIEKFTPSKEHLDLTEYYGITEDSQVAITLNHSVLDNYATLIDGYVYLDYHFIHDTLNSTFYWDSNENILLYTTAKNVVSAVADATRYNVGKSSKEYSRPIVKATADSAWVDLEFAKTYSDFTYNYYDAPARLVINNKWDEITISTLKKDTEVRLKGGIKSPILSDAKKGDVLTILKTDKKWTKVCTADGITGYVKSKVVKKTKTQTMVSEYEPEIFEHKTLDNPISLLWHPMGNQSGNSQISSILSETKGVTVMCPSWFKLKDNKGNLTSYASSDYVNYCHNHGVDVWGMVKNLDLDSPDIDINYILTRTSIRQNLVNQIIAQALQYNLDGINIDFEELSEEKIGDGYIQFLRELSIKCENNDIVLSTAVYTPASYNTVYKYGEQSDFVDYIAIMTYDQHWGQQSGEGSVAALNWVEECINNTINEGVPSEQILLGIPFYTRLWTLTPTSDESATELTYQITRENLGLNSGKRWMENNIDEPVWLEDCGQWYGEIQKNGIIYRMWLEDNDSIEQKLQLVDKYSLAGVAFWSSALDNTSIWDTIIKYIN